MDVTPGPLAILLNWAWIHHRSVRCRVLLRRTTGSLSVVAAILLPAPLLAGNRKYPTEVLSGAIITRVYGFILAEEWEFSSINRKKKLHSKIALKKMWGFIHQILCHFFKRLFGCIFFYVHGWKCHTIIRTLQPSAKLDYWIVLLINTSVHSPSNIL